MNLENFPFDDLVKCDDIQTIHAVVKHVLKTFGFNNKSLQLIRGVLAVYEQLEILKQSVLSVSVSVKYDHIYVSYGNIEIIYDMNGTPTGVSSKS